MTDIRHDLGVIVVNYRRDESAVRAMEQLLESARGDGLRARGILCDNSETIDAGAVERSFEVLPLPNPGYAAAVNAAARRLDADVYLVATHEVEIVSGSVGTLVETARRAGVGAVGPLLIDGRDGSVLSAGKRLVDGTPKHMKEAPGTTEPIRVDGLDGSCWVFSAAARREVGDLDETFFLYWGESDWHARARRAGLTIWCAPRFVVRSAESDLPEATYYLKRNRYYYMERHLSWWRAARHALLDLVLRIPGTVILSAVSPARRRAKPPRARYRLLAVWHWAVRLRGPLPARWRRR